ncbi:hypothetical protein MLD38_030007 [Melastoma candidum]|uniref:Uncharacterized protein n=1 Tax=Melastoma candidum TaxID=119954 RepID=A0ACB9MKP0_9MYRT|nr:hypothetical protein MLD38_030007 [Melastoma candidum]
MEELARCLRLKVQKKDGGIMKLEGSRAGRKGVLGIDAEIFEITPNFHLVEMKKTSGDTLEYKKALKDDIRPALKDIIWAWQGEQLPPPPPYTTVRAGRNTNKSISSVKPHFTASILADYC